MQKLSGDYQSPAASPVASPHPSLPDLEKVSNASSHTSKKSRVSESSQYASTVKVSPDVKLPVQRPLNFDIIKPRIRSNTNTNTKRKGKRIPD